MINQQKLLKGKELIDEKRLLQGSGNEVECEFIQGAESCSGLTIIFN